MHLRHAACSLPPPADVRPPSLLEPSVPPLLPADWSAVLLPQAPLAELAVRATLVYLAVLALLRLLGTHGVHRIGLSDVMLVVLIGAAARRGLMGETSSVGDAVVLVAVILGWHWLLRRLALRWEPVERFLRPAPLVVVREGRMVEGSARREGISRGELEAALRLEGVRRLEEVERAQVEPGGGISVVRRETPDDRGKGDGG